MAHTVEQIWGQVAAGQVNYRGVKTVSAVTANGTAALVKAENLKRLCIMIYNAGAADAYLGPDDTVTTSSGMLLKSGSILTDVSSADAWWVITAGSTADIRIIEVE